jgi:hypothetical protein
MPPALDYGKHGFHLYYPACTPAIHSGKTFPLISSACNSQNTRMGIISEDIQDRLPPAVRPDLHILVHVTNHVECGHLRAGIVHVTNAFFIKPVVNADHFVGYANGLTNILFDNG